MNSVNRPKSSIMAPLIVVLLIRAMIPEANSKTAVAKKAVAKKTVKKPVARKAPAKATKTAKRPVAKKAVVSKPVAKKIAVKKAAASKAAAKKPAAGKVVARKVAKKASAGKAVRKPRAITPKQALANTRALLEAKQAHDREPPPWQALETPHSPAPQPGFQSDEARAKAEELHAGESRMQAIQGSIGSQGRHNQGKRDSR
jgi:hypothetical protein